MNRCLIIGFILFASLVFSQNNVKPKPIVCPSEPSKAFRIKGNDTIFSAAAKGLTKPVFVGGIDSFYRLFDAEFKMPAEHADLKGRIIVKFIVEKDGTLSNIMILRDLGNGTGAETIRVLRKLPKWKPAEYNQKAVRCDFSLPIKIPYEPLTAAQLKVQEIRDK